MMSSEFLKNLSLKEKNEGQKRIMNNFKNMAEQATKLEKFQKELTLSDEQLKQRSMQKVTMDGSILKLMANDTVSNINWVKGMNALFKYKTFTFVPVSNETHAHDGKCQHDHSTESKDFTKSDPSNHLHSKKSEAVKPIKKLIANSDDDGAPFQLRIGMGFTVEMFELCLKTMNVGERSRFLVMPTMLLVSLSKR